MTQPSASNDELDVEEDVELRGVDHAAPPHHADSDVLDPRVHLTARQDTGQLTSLRLAGEGAAFLENSDAVSPRVGNHHHMLVNRRLSSPPGDFVDDARPVRARHRSLQVRGGQLSSGRVDGRTGTGRRSVGRSESEAMDVALAASRTAADFAQDNSARTTDSALRVVAGFDHVEGFVAAVTAADQQNEPFDDDTRCYFNVRSKASQLNLPRGNDDRSGPESAERGLSRSGSAARRCLVNGGRPCELAIRRAAAGAAVDGLVVGPPAVCTASSPVDQRDAAPPRRHYAEGTRAHSCPRVHFVLPDPTQQIS